MKLYKKIQQFFKNESTTSKNTVQKNKNAQPTIDFYEDYPEQPYINPKRDVQDWLKEARTNPNLIVPRENMERDEIGLLAGDIYLLYWLFRYRNQEFPIYFEYFFGIDVNQELNFLKKKNFINENLRPTQEGCYQIDDYAIYLDQMKHFLKQNYPTEKV